MLLEPRDLLVLSEKPVIPVPREELVPRGRLGRLVLSEKLVIPALLVTLAQLVSWVLLAIRVLQAPRVAPGPPDLLDKQLTREHQVPRAPPAPRA